jgi:hypothetical protein
MAGTGVVIGLQITDELGVRANSEFYVQTSEGATIANVVADAQDLATAFDGTIDGKVTGITIGIPLVPNSVKSAPAAGSRVEQTAVVNFTNADNSRKWAATFPSIKNAAISGGKLNMTYAALKAVIDLVQAAATSGTWANFAWSTLVGVADGFLAFRKHRRQVDHMTLTEGPVA